MKLSIRVEKKQTQKKKKVCSLLKERKISTDCNLYSSQILACGNGSTLSYLSHLRVADGVQVHGALVRHVMENVEGPDGLRTLLLVAEDEIDPLVQLTRHKFTLQRLKRQKS